MSCESGVQSCDCGTYFTCITEMPTTTNTNVVTSTEELSSTKKPTTTKALSSTEIATTAKITTTKVVTSTDLSTTAEGSSTTKLSTAKPLTTKKDRDTTTTIAPKLPTSTQESTVVTDSDFSTIAETTEIQTPTDSGNKDTSGMSALVISLLIAGPLMVCCLLAAVCFFGYRKYSNAQDSDCDEVVISLETQKPVSGVCSVQRLDQRDTAHKCASEGDCVTTLGGDEELREVRDALHKVDKMKRDEKDTGFGQALASLRLGNALLEEDVVEDMGVGDDTLGNYESTEAGPGTGEGVVVVTGYELRVAEEKAQEYVTAGGDHLDLRESESSTFDNYNYK